MQLMLYAQALNTAGQNLVEELQSQEEIHQVHTFEDIGSLVAHLRQPLRAAAICILIPADNDALSQLNAIRHLLRDMRIILILPNGRSDTVSQGHSLRPRYVSYVDCPWTDVIAVVRKMIGRDQNKRTVENQYCLSK